MAENNMAKKRKCNYIYLYNIYAMFMCFNFKSKNNVIYLLSVEVLEKERRLSVKLTIDLSIDAMLKDREGSGSVPSLAIILEHVEKYSIMEYNKNMSDDSMKVLNVSNDIENRLIFNNRISTAIKDYRCNY